MLKFLGLRRPLSVQQHPTSQEKPKKGQENLARPPLGNISNNSPLSQVSAFDTPVKESSALSLQVFYSSAAPPVVGTEAAPTGSRGMRVRSYFEDGFYFHEIVAIRPGSLAEQNKLKVGEYIVGINDRFSHDLTQSQFKTELEKKSWNFLLSPSKEGAISTNKESRRPHVFGLKFLTTSTADKTRKFHQISVVIEGSYASSLGLKEGEYITEINGINAATLNAAQMVAEIKKGVSSIETFPGNPPAESIGPKTSVDFLDDQNLTKQMSVSSVHADRFEHRYRIESVKAGSSAEFMGIRPGDVLFHVGGVEAATLTSAGLNTALSNCSQVTVGRFPTKAASSRQFFVPKYSFVSEYVSEDHTDSDSDASRSTLLSGLSEFIFPELYLKEHPPVLDVILADKTVGPDTMEFASLLDAPPIEFARAISASGIDERADAPICEPEGDRITILKRLADGRLEAPKAPTKPTLADFGFTTSPDEPPEDVLDSRFEPALPTFKEEIVPSELHSMMSEDEKRLWHSIQNEIEMPEPVSPRFALPVSPTSVSESISLINRSASNDSGLPESPLQLTPGFQTPAKSSPRTPVSAYSQTLHFNGLSPKKSPEKLVKGDSLIRRILKSLESAALILNKLKSAKPGEGYSFKSGHLGKTKAGIKLNQAQLQAEIPNMVSSAANVMKLGKSTATVSQTWESFVTNWYLALCVTKNATLNVANVFHHASLVIENNTGKYRPLFSSNRQIAQEQLSKAFEIVIGMAQQDPRLAEASKAST